MLINIGCIILGFFIGYIVKYYGSIRDVFYYIISEGLTKKASLNKTEIILRGVYTKKYKDKINLK